MEVTLIPTQAPAIVSNSDLTVQGNASVLGTNGNVHSNAALEVGGSADVDGNATASGGYTETGHPNIGGSTSGTAPHLTVSEVHAADYRVLADLVLTAGGTITDPVGGVICDASADAGACEAAGYTWRYDGADGWRASALGANADNRTFYAETDLTITGNIGTVGNPWNLTLIAEGNIDISGNGVIEADSQGLLFVTNRDLQFTGGKDHVGAEAQVLVREPGVPRRQRLATRRAGHRGRRRYQQPRHQQPRHGQRQHHQQRHARRHFLLRGILARAVGTPAGAPAPFTLPLQIVRNPIGDGARSSEQVELTTCVAAT